MSYNPLTLYRLATHLSYMEPAGMLQNAYLYMQVQATQQGVFESMHRTLMIGVGNWEFSPLMDLENPFPNNEGSVHLWQGDEDRIMPVKLQRYIANKLPWIKYHELPGSGHLFPCAAGMSEVVIRALLSGDKKPTFDCLV